MTSSSSGLTLAVLPVLGARGITTSTAEFSTCHEEAESPGATYLAAKVARLHLGFAIWLTKGMARTGPRVHSGQVPTQSTTGTLASIALTLKVSSCVSSMPSAGLFYMRHNESDQRVSSLGIPSGKSAIPSCHTTL